MKNITKSAFTLAEIMIVLTIIGILAAILIPSAMHSTPNETAMKFKKVHKVFFDVINDIASDGKYYKVGDMRYKPDGTTKTQDIQNYLCQVMSEALSAKTVNCGQNAGLSSIYYTPFSVTCTGTACDGEAAGSCCNSVNAKKKLDSICSNITSPKGITTPDGVIWYEANEGTWLEDPNCNEQVDCNNKYKVFCLKIDGVYFGYGIRSDGKILTGNNVDTYVAKKIQD